LRTLDLALLGFGNAGRAFARLLTEKHDAICRRYDTDIRVTAIATGRHGSLADPDGIDLRSALETVESGGRFPGDDTALAVARSAAYDVLIEATPLNIHTGQPAIDHIRAALERGRHAVTANKGPVAWAWAELRDLARENAVHLFCETTVMDGTPVFNLVERTLPMARVTEVSGILNTTTNFILGRLAAGEDYDAILAEGRRLGFVEADPSMDIDGYDAAAKITALLNVLMDARMTPDRVDRTGIGAITMDDIRAAAERGCVIKLLCRGWVENGEVRASVKPAEVPVGTLPATVDATSSLVSITTDLMGKLSVLEHDPLIEQTAFGIFSDVLRVVEETA
jgi:homoserine dehydrogenase